MQLGNLEVFKIGKEKMRFLGERQQVLALNIANADTPNYKARDLKSPDFKNLVASASNSIQLARTDKDHLAGMQGSSGHYRTIFRDPSDERTPNDNQVVLDEEVQKVAHTQMEYDKVVSIYRKNIGLFRSALGNPNA